MCKLLIFYCCLFFSLSSMFGQDSARGFELKVKAGPGFLSYGDLRGVDRGISLQYGSKWFARLSYNYSNYESSFFSQDFYENTPQLTTQTKHLENFFGPGIQAEYGFGYKLLDVKDILTTITSYQLAAGRKFFLVKDVFSVNLHGNIGIYKLTTISPSVIIRPVDIVNPNYFMEDVTLIGTFTNSFLDLTSGFGLEFSYLVFNDRLSLDLFAKANLGDTRFFSFGVGSSVRI